MWQSECSSCTGLTHDTGEIVNRRFGRDELIGFLAQRPAGRVALEACGSGHWWARKIRALGHEVRAVAREVHSPVRADEQDRRGRCAGDLDGGAAAGRCGPWRRRPRISRRCWRCTGCAALLVKFRTMQVNQLRGLLYEFGVTFRAGRLAGLAEIRARMAELEDELPGSDDRILQDQFESDRRTRAGHRSAREADRRLAEAGSRVPRDRAQCPASAGSPRRRWWRRSGMPKTFKSGREFAAFLGLVPRQSGTGGRVRLGSISQARRPVPAHAADPWRAIGDAPRQGADAVADRDPGAATGQRGGGGHGATRWLEPRGRSWRTVGRIRRITSA